MFLHKPPSDDNEVTDNLDTSFDDDLEVILDSFVGVMSILPAKYGVASPLQYFNNDYFEDVEE